jgi:sortase A
VKSSFVMITGKKILFQVMGIGCALAGIGILTYVFYPILVYEVRSQDHYPNYLLPVPLGEELVYSQEPKSESVDFTKVSNWFEGDVDGMEEVEKGGIDYYTLSIPKLGIKGATVTIGGEDLTKSLIQYPGTALPGNRGNAVIFGHSILPQFFNPKDYVTIFSTLPTIKSNDLVQIEYDGISYEYRVEDVFEVRPTDIQILEQNTSDSFVTLITCVPPGHPLRPKRLVVRARLVPLAERMLGGGT